jgi:hypothetical protein
MGLIDDLLPDVDAILGIRDDLGVALKVVNIVTRTWSGSECGEGTMSETMAQMLPSPRVVEYRKQQENQTGGVVERADIMLKMISKNLFSETDLNFSDMNENQEKFYDIGGELYRPIQVIEKHVVWSVMLRRVEAQRNNS